MLYIYLILVISMNILGVLPLIYGGKKTANIAFSIVSFGFSMWTLANYMLTVSDSLVFWTRISIFGPVFIPVSLLYFVRSYPVKKPDFTIVQTLALLILPAVILMLLPTPSIVKSAPNLTQTEWGFGYIIFALYFCSYLITVMYIMFRGIKKYTGQNRTRLIYVASGLFITLTFGSIFDLILPLAKNMDYISIGPLFSFFFITLSLYSILKYRLMDIRTVINKSIAWLLTFTLLSTIYMIYVWLFQIYISQESTALFLSFTIIYWLCSAAAAQPVRIRLQSRTDKLFIKGKYDYKKVLMKMTDELAICNSIKDLIKIINNNFKNEIEIDPINIYFPEKYEVKKELSEVLKLHKINEGKIILTDQTLDNKNLLIKYIKKENPPCLANDHESDIKQEMKNLNAEAAIPCFYDNQLICLILAGGKMSEDPLNNDDLDLFTTLAPQIAIVLDRIKQARTTAEMEVAKTIQMEILPKKPVVRGLALSCYMNPADHVGGDYYDVYDINKKSWLIMGDVTGHGVGSGLVMFMVQSIISSLLQTNPDITPSELNYQANNVLTQNLQRLNEQRPMTIITISTVDGRHFSISGNHDNIYIYRNKEKKVESISVNTIPFSIGLTNDLTKEAFEENSFQLKKDDILLLATDGIVEAAVNGDYKKEQFGEERLLKFIKEHSDQPIDDIKNKLIRTVGKFTNNIFYDDVTFIIAKAV
ncbi:MAG: SpoIIE family protein phosphatase [bacterium]|nr:SpoIIE family protein phosphatase [bacterium]